MTNRLLIYSLSIVLILIHNFVPLVYGQSSCENADWGSPLEHDLNVRDPFNPPHYGTDYRAADGDNVRTVADGTILTIDYKEKQRPNRLGLQVSGWGKYVVVRHADGSTTLYAHLQEGSTDHLYEGMPVTKSSIIGKVDSTPSGGVTGPHLHLEYAPDGRWWDKQSRKDPHPCIVCDPQNPATVTLSGPDAPTDGSQYTATGGIEPYTWSITKGSITQTGVVTVSGQCGTATVTATDSCGNVETKDVRMPGGVWVFVSFTGVNTCTSGFYHFERECVIMEGGIRTAYGYECGENYGPGGCNKPPPCSFNCPGLMPNHNYIGVEEWRCP